MIRYLKKMPGHWYRHIQNYVLLKRTEAHSKAMGAPEHLPDRVRSNDEVEAFARSTEGEAYWHYPDQLSYVAFHIPTCTQVYVRDAYFFYLETVQEMLDAGVQVVQKPEHLHAKIYKVHYEGAPRVIGFWTALCERIETAYTKWADQEIEPFVDARFLLVPNDWQANIQDFVVLARQDIPDIAVPKNFDLELKRVLPSLNGYPYWLDGERLAYVPYDVSTGKQVIVMGTYADYLRFVIEMIGHGVSVVNQSTDLPETVRKMHFSMPELRWD